MSRTVREAGERPAVGAAGVLASVAAVVTVGVFPVFLVGGLGVQLREDLHFGAVLLGTATAGFFGMAAITSRFMGWLVERIGAGRGMRLAAVGSAACLAGLALAPNAIVLVGLCWIAGLPNSLGQPAANLLIAQGIPPHRRGMGFGVKQSSIPAATLLAGLAVPAIALTIGWRWVFALGVVVAVGAALSVPKIPAAERSAPRAESGADGGVGYRSLLFIAIAGGLGSAAANALGAFVTTTAVHVGFRPFTAGLVLSLGSIAGLTIRLLAGAMADRYQPNLLRVITTMLVVGAVGYALMAASGATPFLLGVAVAFGAGWAWPGLLNFAVAQLAPDRVASATAFTQTGIYCGGSLGPLLFGLLAEHGSLSLAWLSAGALAVLAAGLLLLVRR